MNFEDQIGTEIVRTVASVHGREGRNFGVAFHDFDEMLFHFILSTWTEEQREEQWRRIGHELEADMDPYCHTYDGRTGRRVDPEYGSMRIYHISGKPSETLVAGDAWECEVMKCYSNPKSPKTKDGRTKIHFSLRPLKRLVYKDSKIDTDKGVLIVETECGTNRTREEFPCEVRVRTCRDESGLWAYKVREVVVDGEVRESKVLTRFSANNFMLSLGGSNARMLRRAYRELPIIEV